MFAFAGMLNSIGAANANALHSLGESISTNTLVAASRTGSLHHRSGESNRYTKNHQSRVVNPEPTVPKPSGFRAIFSEGLETFRYAKLTSKESVRVLNHLPVSQNPSRFASDDFVCCRIQEIALRDANHEALSYTWGNAPRDFPIILVNGTGEVRTVCVGPSLYAGMRRLRHLSEERVLWIDQLCINQDDKDEQSQQVLLMGDIYGRAKQTVVWLGEEDKDHEILQETAALFAAHIANTPHQDIDLIKPRLDLQDRSNSRDSWRRHAIVRLLNRPWFSRVWIFQEAVKSPTVTITCGSLEMSLEVLRRISQAVFEVEEAEKGYAQSLTKTTAGFDTLYLIQHTKPDGCGDPECEIGRHDIGFLGILMQALQQLEASKHQDLIYAFLAFRQNIVIEPNYDKPVSSIWTDAARSIIQATGSLDIFAAVRGDETSSEPLLPSWVPDWSRCYPYARPMCAPDFKSTFKACNALLGEEERQKLRDGAICTHEFERADSDSLIVQGTVIGLVSWLCPSNYEGGYYRDGLKSFLRFDENLKYLKAHLQFVDFDSSQLLQHNLEDRLMRTILADGAFGHKQPLVDTPGQIRQICDMESQIEREVAGGPLPPSMRAKKTILDQIRKWSLIAQQKKIFLCEDREDDQVLHLGLAPRAIRPDDYVCLLRGSRVPCLLRKNDQNTYKVVGQCYLDGWMTGEVPPNRQRSFKKIQMKFVLV